MTAETKPVTSTSPTSTASVRHVGIVGSGLMGSGIAEVCARAGVNVDVYDINEGACEQDAVGSKARWLAPKATARSTARRGVPR